MAGRRAKAAPEPTPPFEPYLISVPGKPAFPTALVAARSFAGYIVIFQRPALGYMGHHGVGVYAMWQPDWMIDGGTTRQDAPLQSYLGRLKESMLRYGADGQAVQLVHSIAPFNSEELTIMAGKLKNKGTDAAATEAPKGRKGKAAEGTAEKPKGKGNAEALAKAREARAEAGPDTRKITIKNKENPYRENSGRAAAFDALKGAKTVEDYEKAGGKRKYLSRWVEEGRIELK